ncbi:hypothetical protein HD554DRAFT_307772 [Boletus coccyginus]|nr:hypothetical protein HD554DRAFT_307772 [Boletus coccyginus]
MQQARGFCASQVTETKNPQLAWSTRGWDGDLGIDRSIVRGARGAVYASLTFNSRRLARESSVALGRSDLFAQQNYLLGWNMIPNHSSSTMYDLYQSQNTPDPLDELLFQLFAIPNTLPTTTPTYASASAPPTAPAPAPASSSAPGPTCHWVSRDDPPRICGVPLSSNPKRVCAHLRLTHGIRGNDRVTIRCLWYGCHAAPMQRGSVIRHVLTVHLGLLRWRCEICDKVFSRKGTGHACGGGVHA